MIFKFLKKSYMVNTSYVYIIYKNIVFEKIRFYLTYNYVEIVYEKNVFLQKCCITELVLNSYLLCTNLVL